MTRVLLVETASPLRVRTKAEEILAGNLYPEPQISILCSGDTRTSQYYSEIPEVEIISLLAAPKSSVRSVLRDRNLDVLYMFWTGERQYRAIKAFAFTLQARSVVVDSGDGGKFRLTWKAILRHALFRWRHPLPTDHWKFLSPLQKPAEILHDGERILIVQSAEPAYILGALEKWNARPLFRNPRYTLFCRSLPQIVQCFRGHPLLTDIRVHNEMARWWTHIRSLRSERFDAVAVFFTGDPSYWKIKYLPFLLGARHKVILNENNDCFFFSWTSLLGLLAHRLGERSKSGNRPHWPHPVRSLSLLPVKALLFPFRFAWLLLVWLRLRCAALAAGKENAAP